MEIHQPRDGRGRTPGFKGTRNTDTTKAVAARKAKALQRHLAAAEALLVEKGAIVTWPTTNHTEP